jgi:integration host factor subunit beta
LNKQELISALREQMNLSKPEAANIVDLIFNKMADTLVRGDRVEIRGLCSFHVKKHKSYIGRNPKTGAKVPIKPKKLPFFKAGRELKVRVNR